MMDKLEKYIIENRDSFNVYEPGPAVWDKVQKSVKKTKVRTINWSTVMWRAAIVVLFLATAFTLSVVLQLRNHGSNMADQKLMKKIPELAEAEAYYTTITKNKLEEINKHLNNDPELQKKFLKDVSELDKMYDNLKKDLLDNVETQEIVEAMIQNYRLKLEVLEEILKDLQNSEKTNEHEDKKVQYEL
jgi:hypothetical protein